jgi:hypothetical protein
MAGPAAKKNTGATQDKTRVTLANPAIDLEFTDLESIVLGVVDPGLW